MWVFITLIIFGSDKYIIAGTKTYETKAKCETELALYLEQSGYPLPVKCRERVHLPEELREGAETIWR